MKTGTWFICNYCRHKTGQFVFVHVAAYKPTVVFFIGFGNIIHVMNAVHLSMYNITSTVIQCMGQTTGTK